MPDFNTTYPSDRVDALAPDGSQISFLHTLDGASSVICTLPPGACSVAVTHRRVDEIWYFLAGEGEVWRSQGEREEITPVTPGMALTIPLGTHFQFRNTGADPLRFFIVTLPPWPGAEEAVEVPGRWNQ